MRQNIRNLNFSTITCLEVLRIVIKKIMFLALTFCISVFACLNESLCFCYNYYLKKNSRELEFDFRNMYHTEMLLEVFYEGRFQCVRADQAMQLLEKPAATPKVPGLNLG